jgi:exonuclease V
MLAMKQGNRIHKALEKELHETVRLTQITSHEDIWGLKFLNILFGLHELQLRGMTVCPMILQTHLKREFPVFGFVEDHLVVGIVDQIAYHEDEPTGPLPMDAFITIIKKRSLVISDVKTRVNASLPNSRQSRPAELQLSLYHQLISDMINGDVDVGRVYPGLSLNGDTPFTDGFLAEAAQSYSTAGVIAFDTLLENNTLNVNLSKLH